MSNVVKISEWKKGTSKSEVSDKSELDEAKKKNEENIERMVKERLKHNKKTLREYRIKTKRGK